MARITPAFVASATIAVLALVVGYGLGAEAIITIAMAVIAALWLIAESARFLLASAWLSAMGTRQVAETPSRRLVVRLLKSLSRLSTPTWVLFVVAAAIGMLSNLKPGLMLLALVAGLCAWDLAGFAQQLDSVERVDEWPTLARRHLTRLALVAICGLALAGLALLVRVPLDFGVTVVLALVGAATLGLAVRTLVATNHI